MDAIFPMMKRALFLLALFHGSGWLSAQNEPFLGGPGSGGAQAASGTLSPPSSFPNLYQGGYSDGATSNTSGAVTPPEMYTELYTGGPADGAASSASGAVTPPETYPELYAGGLADGAASNTSGAVTPPETYPELYAGGPADGATSGASGQLLPPFSGQELFAGGSSDGFAFNASGMLFSPAGYAELFAGGPADGFATTASGTISPPPTYAQLYGGAASDGFSYHASGPIEPPPTYPQAYSGGMGDGHDRAKGSFPVSNDLAVSNIQYPRADTLFPAGNEQVFVVLKNEGIAAISSAEIRWSINNVPQSPLVWSGNLGPNEQETVALGEYFFAMGIPHDVIAYSFQPNGMPDPLLYNDTAKAVGLYAALNGTYTLGGPAPDLPTFQSAAAALNNGGVLGPVHILARDGVYNEQFALGEIRGTSAINTVVFQSESEDSTTVLLTYVPTALANYVVLLDGTDWTIFKHLGFRTPNQSHATVFVFRNSAEHNAFRHNRIVSEGHTNPLVDGLGSYTEVHNNRFENGSHGIIFPDNPSGPNVPGVAITDNLFQNQPQHGLVLRFADAATVRGNHFVTNVAADGYRGIGATNCSNATHLTQNSIATNAGSGIVLQNSSGAPGQRVQVANNMVAIAGGATYTNGILLNSNYVDVWHNTVRHGGSHPGSAAFYAEGGNNNAVQNNVFAHVGNGYAVAANAPDNIAASDYNNYFVNGNAVLGRWAGIPVAALAAWQVVTGRDMHTLSINPLFVSGTDLHVAQAQLNGAGIPIAEVPYDIDGQPRDGAVPDIGADEIGALPDDAGVTAILAPVSGCALGGSETVRVRIQNFGSAPLDDFDVAFRLDNNPPVTQSFTGPAIPPGASAEFVFATAVNLSALGDYSLRVFTEWSADARSANDTVAINLTNAPVPAMPSNLLPTDNSLYVPVNPTLSWQPAAAAMAYDIALWPSAGLEPAGPTVANLSQISYVFQPPLVFGTGYNWRVTSKNTWCSTPGAVQHFTTVHLPDLVPVDLASVTTAVNGQQIAVQWNTLNQGAGPTTVNWGESVYLSEDAELGDDVFLGSIGNFGALMPSDTFSNALNVTLPVNRFGTFYLLVVLDQWQSLPEFDEANNVVALPIQINLNPPPDLEVISVAAPPVGIFPSGRPVQISWTVANTGDGPTTHGTWTDRFFYSTNPVFQPNTAILFAEKTHVGNLAVSAAYSDNLLWNIPNSLSGIYYVYVTTDIYNAEFEHAFESNNTTRSNAFTLFVPGTPDLNVTRVAPPPSGSNKAMVNIQWTVKNEGLANALPNWRDRVYLSRSANETNMNSAIFLGDMSHSDTLVPGDSAVMQRAFAIPDGITGQYFVHVFTDADDQVFEYSGANLNNLGHSANPLLVLTPDLVAESLVAPDTAQAGTEMLIYWTVKNQSPVATLVNGSWTDRLSISPSPVPGLGFVTELTTLTSSSTLLPNGILLRQVTALAPGGVSGQRYVHLDIDFLNTVYEQTGENNNRLAVGAPVFITPSNYPDLQPTVLTPGANAAAGSTLAFDFAIENTGTGIGQGAAWQDNVYMQNSPTFNVAQAILLASFPVIQSISAGGGYSTSGSAVLPAGLTPGIYYLFVHTDAGNTLFENSIEANNILGSAGFTVGAYPPVDLAVTDVETPDTVVAGEAFPMAFSVENRTAVATPQSSWLDGVFLSTDALFSPGSDVLVTTNLRSQALAGNSAYTIGMNATIPAGTATGRYWLFAVADQQFLNLDSNPGNNAGVRRNANGAALPLFVQFAPPPDLAVFNVSAPAAVVSGQPFPLVFSIANQGVGPTVSGAWSDVFFLSDDFQLNAGDFFLGAVTHAGNLAPGGSYTDTVALTIPVPFGGNRVLLVVTDHNNAEYEHFFEQNNTAASAVLITQPASADLVPENVSGPALAIAGESATFTWHIVNRGQNLAQGYRRDALYLSLDTAWQASDPLLGFLDLNFNLPPQNTETHSLMAPLTGVAVDTYFVLVRTDILSNIYESSDSNNTAVSALPVVVTVPLLPLDTLLTDTLTNNASLYYRIEIPPILAEETMLVTLQAMDPAVNELYLRHGQAPTRVVHDFKFSTPFAGNQEIVVPSLLTGTYYLLAYGSTTGGPTQVIRLMAEIIDFQVLSVQANKGGNTGSMTLKVKGAKFSPGMILRLAGSTDTITAHAVHFTDATQVFATFNLAGAATGFYDVIAEKSDGEKAVLLDGFEVVTGSVTGTNGDGNLGGFYCNIENVGADALTAISIQHPPSTRPNRLVTMQVNFGNNGNVDIPAPTRFIVSQGGAPLAFDVADLPENAQELLLKFEEPGGPPGVLRPGVTGTIVIVTKAIAPLQFSIEGN